MNPLDPLLTDKLVKSSLSWLNNPYKVLLDASHLHGASFYLKLPMLGRTLVTGDAKLIKEIRQSPDLVGGRGMTVLRPILTDESLIMKEGSEHAQRRKALASLFTAGRIQASDDSLKKMADLILPLYWNRSEVPVYEMLRKIFLKVIVEFIFHESHDSRKIEIEALVEDFLGSFEHAAFLFVKPLQKNIPFTPWRKFSKTRENLMEAISQEIKDGKLSTLDGKGLDHQACGSEIMSLLLFGHDTAAATSAWAMHHISQNQNIIPRFCKDDNFRDSVLYETMRLNPVVVHLTRVATRDLNIGSFEIKEGDRVLPCVYLAHHNPDVFEDPGSFHSERFIGGTDRYDGSYFPFGFGRRVCIGKYLALRQMQTLLPHLYTLAKFDPQGNKRTRAIRENVIMVPSNGLKMKVTAKN
ncbi:cytochrome P450 [Oligoflexaceae bacterium]|nr:cytochrome P450 [Oligoflexaceae bacterium]